MIRMCSFFIPIYSYFCKTNRIRKGGTRRMIDLETGIMDIEGVVMTPDSKLEDFKKYDANLVGIDVWGKGWGIITIKKWIRSNGIDASVKFRIDEGENSRQIIIEPTLINQSGMRLCLTNLGKLLLDMIQILQSLKRVGIMMISSVALSIRFLVAACMKVTVMG